MSEWLEQNYQKTHKFYLRAENNFITTGHKTCNIAKGTNPGVWKYLSKPTYGMTKHEHEYMFFDDQWQEKAFKVNPLPLTLFVSLLIMLTSVSKEIADNNGFFF